MNNSIGYELIIISLVLILIIIIVVKPLRELGLWFSKDILIPAISWIINYLLLFILKIAKDILLSHYIIVKNMFVPRSIIFINLDSQRDSRDKAMNRKKGN